MTPITFTIYGEPASAKNSRRLVHIHGRTRFIKSTKALAYVKAVQAQAPKLPKLLEGDLSITITIWYASRRPDLDESLLLDALQGLIYSNDRQIKQRTALWNLDKLNPRAVVTVELL